MAGRKAEEQVRVYPVPTAAVVVAVGDLNVS